MSVTMTDATPTPTAPPRQADRWTRMVFAVLERIAVGRLTLVLPDGQSLNFQGPRQGPEATVIVRDQAAFRRFVTGGDIGFAEAFMDGLVDVPDLPALMELFVLNTDKTGHNTMARPVVRMARRVMHWLNRNTRRGSKRNIAFHYDLGNAFYERWLDPSMTYSSAVFEGSQQDLQGAQRAKYARIAEALDLKPGKRVLEIGCGWGGFAEFAARETGAEVVGVTLSREQLAYARDRMARQGLADRVDLRLQDYRDVEGHFDAVASIEMFEAVGQRYWQTFYDTMRDRLRPGGRAALQIITIAENSFEDYRRNPDFIQRYIFPGGMLPTRAHLRDLADRAALTPLLDHGFGLDYARTLKEWRERFLAAWPEIEPLGFDERFRRMWSYYLAYCEGGFRAGNVDVRQIALERTG